MLDEGLKKIIESKDITNFWELFEYLNTIGYGCIDSLGISLNFFSESKIYQDVAFIRLKTEQIEDHFYVGGCDPIYPQSANDHSITFNKGVIIKEYATLRVGIITNENRHMRGLYEYYNKALAQDKLKYNDHQIVEIEQTCKIIYEFNQLPSIVLSYLGDVAEKHYGFKPIQMINS